MTLHRSALNYATLLAMVACAAPAHAQAGVPDQGSARMAMARTLVATLKSEQQMRAQQAKSHAEAESTFDRLVPVQLSMRAQLDDPQGYARTKAEAIRIIEEDRQRVADETIPLMIDAEVRRYASHFTVEELRSLNQFYGSPLGQRLIAEQPLMAADSSQFQQSVLAPIASAHSTATGPKLLMLLTPILRQPAAPGTVAGKKP